MKRIVVLCSILLLLVPFTAVAQIDFCEGNFDYDRDQDGTDAFTFKTDFGRSTLLNPCPDNGPAPVEKTGQSLCYDNADNPINCTGTGQDGEYQKGVALPNPRFTDNGNGTVTDNLTGLVWLKDANCSLFNPPLTWDDALKVIDTQLADGHCGLTDGSVQGDWRLPNYKELISLVDIGNFSPALPSGHPFTDVQAIYWTSTNFVGDTFYAWQVIIGTGYVSYDAKNDPYYVWPVRGGH